MIPHISFRLGILCCLLLLLTACAAPAVPEPATSPTPTAPQTRTPTASPSPQPESTITSSPSEPSPTPERTATATPDLRLRPENWRAWPVIPSLSPDMVSLYKQGLAAGNDPHAFSMIGDCQSSPTYFLSIYDEGRYTLSEDQVHLEETIAWYQDSFEHRSVAVKNGMTAPGALNPLWADPEQCESQETPVECELRLHNPSLVIISLGTNWHPSTSQEKYITYLTQIVTILLDHHVVPVLSTKADNAEGDHSRNLAMAQVAYDNHLPLWNFWAAAESLPNMGLDDARENVYLNHRGWDVRNQSALELLHALRLQLLESH